MKNQQMDIQIRLKKKIPKILWKPATAIHSNEDIRISHRRRFRSFCIQILKCDMVLWSRWCDILHEPEKNLTGLAAATYSSALMLATLRSKCSGSTYNSVAEGPAVSGVSLKFLDEAHAPSRFSDVVVQYGKHRLLPNSPVVDLKVNRHLKSYHFTCYIFSFYVWKIEKIWGRRASMSTGPFGLVLLPFSKVRKARNYFRG